MRFQLKFVCFGLVMVCLPVSGAHAIDRAALGLAVAVCLASAELTSTPAPCLAVGKLDHELGGYAVLREPIAKQRTILAATSEISGIEDPRLLKPGAPNFFAAAWAERGRLYGSLKTVRPLEGLVFAINPQNARSQDRLHVHIACLDVKSREAISKRVVAVNPNRFAALNFRLHGRIFWAMRIAAADLTEFNPLQVLAAKMPGAASLMGEHLLLVLDERLPNGEKVFVLLTNRPDGSSANRISVEDFLDPTCSEAEQ